MARYGVPYAQLTDFQKFIVDDAVANAPKPGPAAQTQVLQGPDGRTHLYEFNPATGKFDIDLGLTGNAPTSPGVSVNVSNPGATASVTAEQLVAAGYKEVRPGYWVKTEAGVTTAYEARRSANGTIGYDDVTQRDYKILNPGKSGTGVSPVDALLGAQKFGAAQGAAPTATSAAPTTAATPMDSGAAGTPYSNPMLGQDVMGGATGKSYFGTWMPAGGGSSLVSPNSINSSTSTLAAMGFALPADPQAKVDSEAYASALMQQFGFDVAKAMLKQAQNTGGLTPTETASPYQPETYAEGGSMTIREPSVIQGILSGQKYGILGASPERVSNITPLGSEREQDMAGRYEAMIAAAMGGPRTFAHGGSVNPDDIPLGYEDLLPQPGPSFWGTGYRDINLDEVLPGEWLPAGAVQNIAQQRDTTASGGGPYNAAGQPVSYGSRSAGQDWGIGNRPGAGGGGYMPAPAQPGVLPGEGPSFTPPASPENGLSGWLISSGLNGPYTYHPGYVYPDGRRAMGYYTDRFGNRVQPRLPGSNGGAGGSGGSTFAPPQSSPPQVPTPNVFAEGGSISTMFDTNNNGIDDREEEWTNPDGSKYKRKSRHEPIPRPTPPTPNVFAQGGSIAYNPQHDPLVLEMQARAINRRARKMLPKGMI